MTFIKGIPFAFKGVENVEDCKTSEEVMKKAKLDWSVAKCELVAKIPNSYETSINDNGFIKGSNFYTECPNAFGVYRTDNNIPLGVVKGKYTIVQNIEAFKFFDSAIGKNKAIFQTAGCFGNGERIFVSAKLPKNILVNGNDPVENYLIFTTTHDASGGVRILLSPIRPVCGNTLSAAISSSDNFVSFRHTSSVADNMTSAAELLGICERKIDIVQHSFDEMYKIKYTDKDTQNLFASLVLSKDEFTSIKETGHTIQQLILKDWPTIEDTGISMKKVNTIHEMNKYYFDGIGQKEITGTGWGVYNAITGYYSNIDNAIGIKRMDSLLYGDKSNKIKDAGNLILNFKF